MTLTTPVLLQITMRAQPFLSVVETNGSLDGEIGEDETINNYVNFFGDSSKKLLPKIQSLTKTLTRLKSLNQNVA